MKVLFVFRDGSEADFLFGKIARRLNSKFELILIKETGVIAKRKKLKRILNSKPMYMAFVKMIDLISIQIFNGIFGLKSNSKSKTNQVALFDDINLESCISKINSLSPDLVIIFGTGIVSADSIKKIKSPIFNIHTGVLPYYRNVYSEFWALLNKDYKNIGSTLIKIDPGIDTGNIYKVGRVNLEKDDTYSKVKEKNLELASSLVADLLKQKTTKKKIKLVSQDSLSSKSYPAPGLLDIVKYLWFSARK